MKDISIFVAVLCLIIACLTSGCSAISLMSYEMRVSLKQLPLPISMSGILQTNRKLTGSNRVSKILVKMGHLTGTHENYLFPRGITTYIYNQTVLQDGYLTQLKSLLQISQDRRFQIYLQGEKMTLVSDPNDRFCTQHLQYYLRYFFPCKTFASLGLQKLISPSRLFENYLSFEFEWLAEAQEIYMKIVFPRQRQIVEVKKQTNCGMVSVSGVYKDQSTSASNSFAVSASFEASMINRWYNPRKCIAHIFQFGQQKDDRRVKVISMLPLGFIFDNITFYPPSLNFTYQTIRLGSSLFIIYQFAPNNLQESSIRIHINFHSSLPPFETFQTIAGGGQQIMNVPLFFEGNRMLQLYSPIISERLLQPDFSIPFQTITFTVGIVGYLWINLWRIYKIDDEKTKIS